MSDHERRLIMMVVRENVTDYEVPSPNICLGGGGWVGCPSGTRELPEAQLYKPLIIKTFLLIKTSYL